MWWLSFCDPDRPKGEQFLGVALVRAPTMIAATIAAHVLGCNPGGEVLGSEVPCATIPHVEERWIHRLLTRAEVATMEDEMRRKLAS